MTASIEIVKSETVTEITNTALYPNGSPRIFRLRYCARISYVLANATRLIYFYRQR